MAPSRPQAGRASLEVRASQNSRDRDKALSQNFSVAVHVFQKDVECAKPLLEAANNLPPFIARENLRQQVTEPRIMMIPGRKLERDAQFSQRRIQSFLQFPQVRRRCAFQLAHKSGIGSAGLPCLRIKHFVPAFLRALSVVLYHTGLFSADVSAENALIAGGDALEGSCLQLPSARSPYAQFPR